MNSIGRTRVTFVGAWNAFKNAVNSKGLGSALWNLYFV